MKRVLVSLWILACVCRTAAFSAEIEGVIYPERLELRQTTLVLQSTAMLRWGIGFKGYAAGLYLPEGLASSRVLEDVPKRLELSYFWAIPGKDFGPAGEKILLTNVTDTVHRALRARLDRINALYVDVNPSDRYALTYFPGVGMELALNGRRLGVIEGADFARAYFSIWLGEKPISASLKTQLLGAAKKTKRKSG